MIDKICSTFARRMAVSLAALSFATTLSAQTAPAAAAQTPAAPAPDWKTYSYPSDGFSASFAFEPAEQKKNVPTDAGTFELRAYISQHGEAAMFVGICDYGTAACATGAGSGAVADYRRFGDWHCDLAGADPLPQKRTLRRSRYGCLDLCRSESTALPGVTRRVLHTRLAGNSREPYGGAAP